MSCRGLDVIYGDLFCKASLRNRVWRVVAFVGLQANDCGHRRARTCELEAPLGT